MVVDANLLLFARDAASPFHARARAWLTEQLNGPTRVGLPWQSMIAFVRIATHPRAYEQPLSPEQAWGQVLSWLAAAPVWIPQPTDRHAEVVGALITGHQLRGNLISDAHLGALAIEHGLAVCSADSDFARFPEVRWINPLTG